MWKEKCTEINQCTVALEPPKPQNVSDLCTENRFQGKLDLIAMADWK